MSYISICFYCYVIAQQLPSLTLVVCFVVANILIAKFIAGLGALLTLRTITVMTRVSHLSFTDELCIHFLAIITVRGIIRPVMMAAFAVVVCIIIMKSISAVKFNLLFICLLAIWLVYVVFSSIVFLPASCDYLQWNVSCLFSEMCAREFLRIQCRNC